ncbi:MarR family winged helix-turn-helix transcriptional regulator [Catenuloplanes atrovinosus]|uniref:DNA-binding MarR family transcriptional regulator n=1 Tax=Catenuloplanes atrovinosus TaxID=137266 RepID=A0AAE3YRB2_9ACTN|nr:MarR family winged helix-turn-helix transcriptional regulator [Catenuloplanes atrovinosus]MDR7277217.1 DNA-binding MarR family transcriptional regulator [Catenuloplanes atrovinosus]
MEEESLPAWNLVRTAHVVGLRFVDLLAAVDLTPTQFAVLMHLEQGQGLSQAELARRILVRPQSMAPLVSSLIERGYIVRDGPGGRGRRAGIALTDAGREAMEHAWPAVRALNTSDAMGITPAQAAMLDEILDRIRHAIEKGT